MRGAVRAAGALAVAAAAGTLALSAGAAPDAERPGTCLAALVPAYVHPEALAALPRAPRAGRLVVLNPASGPGARPDPAWRAAAAAARRAGAEVLGYVPTGWGARDAAAVQADVERHRAWYGVDGVFLDEAPADAGRLGWTAGVVRAARGAGARAVALNPGVVPAEGYLALADVLVTFEGDARDHAAAVARTPGWLRRAPAARVAHLVHGASRGDALGALARAGGRARVYATPGSGPNPWGTVPAWLADLEARQGACSRG